MMSENYEKKYEICALINTRDRHSELSLLLQSLRTQVFQNFNVIILDESQTPVDNCEFLVMLINQLKQEGHGVLVERNILPRGVCEARNKIVDIFLSRNNFGNLAARIDDDCILEPTYFLELVKGIDLGYDIMSGVTPSLRMPTMTRDISYVKPIINKVVFDNEGNLLKNGDDCGVCYDENVILPAHHFRSCALVKREVHKSIRYPTNLTPVGFREEEFFSMQAVIKGYRIGVNTAAIARHFQTMSGGCRFNNYAELVACDDKTFNDWMREEFRKNGDFLKRCEGGLLPDG